MRQSAGRRRRSLEERTLSHDEQCLFSKKQSSDIGEGRERASSQMRARLRERETDNHAHIHHASFLSLSLSLSFLFRWRLAAPFCIGLSGRKCRPFITEQKKRRRGNKYCYHVTHILTHTHIQKNQLLLVVLLGIQ